MKCPFELPVEAKISSADPDLRYIVSTQSKKGGYICGDIHKEYADYIVQAINSYEAIKLLDEITEAEKE